MKLTTAVTALLPQAVFSSSLSPRQTPLNGTTASLSPNADRWPNGLHLAVDYYPSQWPESMWESDIARIASSNFSYVRVNEFDWGIFEPAEGQYNFTVLDRTLELFAKYGLQAIIGTPTATPPNWLTEKYYIDFVDQTNQTLQFGSRRHYSFSSFDYRVQSQKITRKLAERYGNHSAVVGWQLDNEFGCHSTVRSYDRDAITRFRTWLEEKYGTIDEMNARQGRVFWSSQYASFETVQPPFLEVYTLNEAHTLDWYTFSSDMVIDFAKEQTIILRELAPTHAVTTNFMVLFTDFDHHRFNREVGLDFATYDSYPVAAAVDDPALLRSGNPDLQAMMHALYRGVSGAAYGENAGPFGVMELQPGVLNWSPYRVSPWEGMVRLWTHETFAAFGNLVSYFRWRQVPYAQEQTLSGLFVSDNSEDQGYVESQVVAQQDLPKLEAEDIATEGQADVALVFDYTANWVWAIEPYSGEWSVKDAMYTDPALTYTTLVSTFYSALRRLGLSVDIISPTQSLEGYKMVVVPSLPIIPDTFDTSLSNFSGSVVFGPHTGSRTKDFAYPPGLNPSAGTLREKLPMRVTRVETPPEYAHSGVSYAGKNYRIASWEEWLFCPRDNGTSSAPVSFTSPHRPGKPAACAKDGMHYLAFNPPVEFLIAYLADVAAGVGVRDVLGREVRRENDLGETLRVARRGDLVWVTNYGSQAAKVPETDGEAIIRDGKEVERAGVQVWSVSRE